MPVGRLRPGHDRVAQIRSVLEREDLSALVCTLPSNVLLLSGYWPVVGTACAVIWRHGPVLVIAPSDERRLAERGWADLVRVIDAGVGTTDGLRAPLAAAAHHWGGDRVGIERGPSMQPASYAAMCVYGASLWDIARDAWPRAELRDADACLGRLRSLSTAGDITMVSKACELAGSAFARAPRLIRAGVRETEAAARIRGCLGFRMLRADDRADGYVFCMSGLRAAKAYGSYAESTGAAICNGDFVLVHCNAHVNGHWTDVTRTYCLGDPDAQQRTIYDAVFAARDAALRVIRPGVAARHVDQAARDTLGDAGYAHAFKHATGHGVGFSAIDPEARPRIAPTSPNVLEAGMIFNVEPAVYLDDYGGVRHCDVVAVTDTGYHLLTPFQATPSDLIVRAD